MKESFVIQVLDKTFDLEADRKYIHDIEVGDPVWRFRAVCSYGLKRFTFYVLGNTVTENPEGNFSEAIAVKGLCLYSRLALTANLSIDDFIKAHNFLPYEEIYTLVRRYQDAIDAKLDFSRLGILTKEIAEMAEYLQQNHQL